MNYIIMSSFVMPALLFSLTIIFHQQADFLHAFINSRRVQFFVGSRSPASSMAESNEMMLGFIVGCLRLHHFVATSTASSITLTEIYYNDKFKRNTSSISLTYPHMLASKKSQTHTQTCDTYV